MSAPLYFGGPATPRTTACPLIATAAPVVLTMRPRCSRILAFFEGLEMSKHAFLVGTHQTAVARDIRDQNNCQPPLRARCSRRTPMLVEIEWHISEL
jgi:hypothetical protein